MLAARNWIFLLAISSGLSLEWRVSREVSVSHDVSSGHLQHREAGRTVSRGSRESARRILGPFGVSSDKASTTERGPARASSEPPLHPTRSPHTPPPLPGSCTCRGRCEWWGRQASESANSISMRDLHHSVSVRVIVRATQTRNSQHAETERITSCLPCLRAETGGRGSCWDHTAQSSLAACGAARGSCTGDRVTSWAQSQAMGTEHQSPGTGLLAKGTRPWVASGPRGHPAVPFCVSWCAVSLCCPGA